MGLSLTTRQSVNQLSPCFDAEFLENIMGVCFYGSLTQNELARYSFVPETTSNQERGSLFSIGQHDSLIRVLTVLPQRELGFDVVKPVRPQSKQTVGNPTGHVLRHLKQLLGERNEFVGWQAAMSPVHCLGQRIGELPTPDL